MYTYDNANTYSMIFMLHSMFVCCIHCRRLILRILTLYYTLYYTPLHIPITYIPCAYTNICILKIMRMLIVWFLCYIVCLYAVYTAALLYCAYSHYTILYTIHHYIYRYADDTPHSKGPNAILHQRSERIMLKTAMKLDSLTERILQAKNLSINQNNSKFGKNTYLTDLEIGRVIISLLYRCILLS